MQRSLERRDRKNSGRQPATPEEQLPIIGRGPGDAGDLPIIARLTGTDLTV